MARQSSLLCFSLATIALANGAPASAQSAASDSTTAFQVEQLEPVPGMGMNILNVETSRMLPTMQLAADLLFHYVSDPLVLAGAEQDDVIISALIEEQLKGELAVAFGVTDWFSAGIVLPFTLTQSGQDLGLAGRPGESIGGASVSDIRVHLKAQVLNPADYDGFGLTVSLPVYLPVGDSDQFAGDSGLRIRPTIGADWRHDSGLLIAANAGFSLRPERAAHNFVNDNAFHYAVGVEIPSFVWDRMTIIASLFGAVQTADNRDPFAIEAGSSDLGTGDRSDDPLEIDAGLRFRVADSWTAVVGAGGGLTSAVGNPAFRGFLGAGYAPVDSDADGDGISDAADACPKEPEDLDGYEDSDGCPDDDNDGDGVADIADGAADETGFGSCRNQPEDRDGFEDADGCPDTDNDNDGVPDIRDGATEGGDFGVCLNAPEDRDGFEDDDGCPDTDNDKDGVPDVADGAPGDEGFGACMNLPEDVDNFQDDDGCPDTDNDQDTIPDSADKCPMQPESMNGVADEDGCPDTASEDVKIKGNKIVILKKVFFVYSKAAIKRKSHALLNEVAQVLKDNPWIKAVRVDGHTDSAGNVGYNLDLSRRRAAAVMHYLLNQGLDPSRLSSQGFGEDRPLESNATPEGRAANRRVEFTILETEGRSNAVGQDDNRPATLE